MIKREDLEKLQKLLKEISEIDSSSVTFPKEIKLED